MKLEKRNHVRYLPQFNAFAALGRKYSKVGKLKDISRSGLSFEYINGESTSDDDYHIDIFLSGNLYHLYNVPCEVVYDIVVHVPHVDSKYVKILTMKRCGVQFVGLNEQDSLQIALFLKTHTIGLL